MPSSLRYPPTEDRMTSNAEILSVATKRSVSLKSYKSRTLPEDIFLKPGKSVDVMALISVCAGGC